MIPSIYEVTNWVFNKHWEVFQDILKYRKLELYKYYVQEFTDNMDNDFAKLIHIEELILHELKFIFKVSNKHNKLCKKWNFLYIRDLLINKNSELMTELLEYKKKIKIYNKFLSYKKALSKRKELDAVLFMGLHMIRGWECFYLKTKIK